MGSGTDVASAVKRLGREEEERKRGLREQEGSKKGARREQEGRFIGESRKKVETESRQRSPGMERPSEIDFVKSVHGETDNTIELMREFERDSWGGGQTRKGGINEVLGARNAGKCTWTVGARDRK